MASLTMKSINTRLNANTPKDTGADAKDVQAFVKKAGTDASGALHPRFTPERISKNSAAASGMFDSTRDGEINDKDIAAKIAQGTDPKALTPLLSTVDYYVSEFDRMDTSKAKGRLSALEMQREFARSMKGDMAEAYVSSKVFVSLFDENGDAQVGRDEMESLAADIRAQVEAYKSGRPE